VPTTGERQVADAAFTPVHDAIHVEVSRLPSRSFNRHLRVVRFGEISKDSTERDFAASPSHLTHGSTQVCA
jgi:hypothetical protein